MSEIKWLRPSGSTIITENTKELAAYAKSAGWAEAEVTKSVTEIINALTKKDDATAFAKENGIELTKEKLCDMKEELLAALG